MPFYEFKCKCGREETAFFHMNENHRVICPVCQKVMPKNYSKMIPSYHDVPFDSVDMDLTGEPIVYHTRGQLKKIAREHGCSVQFGTRQGVSKRNDEIQSGRG